MVSIPMRLAKKKRENKDKRLIKGRKILTKFYKIKINHTLIRNIEETVE